MESPIHSIAAISPSASRRFDRLDALRGVAIVWMAVFHFSFDLDHFGLIHQHFHSNPVWTVQRTCILSLFLLCAGAGQAVAMRQGASTQRFWRRWLQIAGCAVLVSIGSWWMFPQTFISFGVLHGMALMLVLLRIATHWIPPGRLAFLLWPAGAVAVLLPRWLQHPFFDSRWTNWTGLVTHKPFTEDYVPLLPWIGVMMFGWAAADWLLSTPRPAASCQAPRGGMRKLGAAQRFFMTAPTLPLASGPPRGMRKLGAAQRFLMSAPPNWLTGPLPAAGRPLAVLGRWPLTFYMLHQPLWIGALQAWLFFRL